MTIEERMEEIADAVKTAPEVVASTALVAHDGSAIMVYWTKTEDDGDTTKFIWFFNKPEQMEAYIATLQQVLASMQLDGGTMTQVSIRGGA